MINSTNIVNNQPTQCTHRYFFHSRNTFSAIISCCNYEYIYSYLKISFQNICCCFCPELSKKCCSLIYVNDKQPSDVWNNLVWDNDKHYHLLLMDWLFWIVLSYTWNVGWHGTLQTIQSFPAAAFPGCFNCHYNTHAKSSDTVLFIQ